MQEIRPRQVVKLDLSASNSLSGVVSTLIPLSSFCGCVVLCFLFLRWRVKPLYRPRPHLGLQQPTPPASIIRSIFSSEADYIVLKDQSLDAYLFLRFVRWLIRIALYGCAITWPILLPVNATGGGRTSQFDTLAVTNVRSPTRFYGHVACAGLFYGVVLLSVYSETRICIRLRQVYLLRYRDRSPRTYRSILYGQVSREDAKGILERLEGVRAVRQLRDNRQLQAMLDLRDKLVSKLESNLVRLSSIAHKCATDGRNVAIENREIVKWAGRQVIRVFMPGRWRPQLLPLSEVILQLLKELAEAQSKIHELQDSPPGRSRDLRVAFVEFQTMAIAERFSHASLSHEPNTLIRLAARARPSEVLWPSIGLPLWKREARGWLSLLIFMILVLAWSPIATSVGVLSNINYVESLKPFHWLNRIPDRYIGVLTGLVPSTVLTIILSLIPLVLRVIARGSGAATMAQAELLVQRWFFYFQVIQVFLLVTIGSSASAVLDRIKVSPVSISVFLAGNLPKASNFYITYFITYGLSSSASTVLNFGALLVYVVLSSFWDDTPRKRQLRLTSLPEMEWGTAYPKFSMLGVIFLTYAILCPLILGFAAFALGLLYLAFRYNIRSVLDCTARLTDGEYYIRALQHVTIGIYLGLVCLMGLFLIRTLDSIDSIGPASMIAVMILCALVGQYYTTRTLRDLSERLPVDYMMQSEVLPSNQSFAPELYGLEQQLRPFLDTTGTGATDATNDHPCTAREDPVLQLVSDYVNTMAEWGATINRVIDYSDSTAYWDKAGSMRMVSEERYERAVEH